MANVEVGPLTVRVDNLASPQEAARVATEAVQFGAASARVHPGSLGFAVDVTLEFKEGRHLALRLVRLLVETVGDPQLRSELLEALQEAG